MKARAPPPLLPPLTLAPVPTPVQLWDQLTNSPGGVLPLEALWLAVFLGWALLHLLLAQFCPGTYLRYRTPIVLLSRLQRQLTSE